MLDAEIKRRINNARNILVGKVPDPKTQVEQITTALIYKFMDDMDLEAEELGGKPQFFVGELKEFSWRRLMSKELSGVERWQLYTRALDAFSKSERIPELFRRIFKDAYLPYRDSETLNLFLKEINEFTYDHSENLGNAYEYLLSILGSQGDAGQFRTPRHIIDFIVEIVAPDKKDRILDPACGTAGFLISSYKHIIRKYSSNYDENTYIPSFAETQAKDVASVEVQRNGGYKGDLLSPDDRIRLSKNIIGYDISPDMVRLSLVNLYLHGFSTPQIFEYDTLTYEERWDEQFDVILANPPFMTPKGGIRPHKRFQIQANRSEVLFVDYIAEHLTINGKAGIIVPEGIIFQSAKAYKALRKNLVENWGLYAVVSLPSGVFQPYAGVKTSILFLDRRIAKRTDEILFVKVENDGFDLGAQRRRIDKNDLPEAYKILKAWQRGEKIESKLALWVKKEKLAENEEYNLTGDRYRETIDYSKVKWPMVKLGDICELFTDGDWIETKDQSKNGIRLIQTGNIGNGECLDKPEKARFIDEETFNKLNCTEVFPNDILISRLPEPVGRACLVPKLDTRMIAAVDCTIVRVDRTKILPHYLLYLTISNEYYNEINQYLTGSSRKRISRKNLGKVKIPLPPLEVQKEIVAELDSYQKIIDGARQVVENWKPRIKIDPNWPKVKLGEVCREDKIQIAPSSEIGKDLPYLGMEDVKSGTGEILRKNVNPKIKSTTFLFDERHILYGKLRPYLNKVALPDFKGKCTTEFIPLLPINSLREYLVIFLRDQKTIDYIMQNKSGTRMPRADVKKLLELKIPLPPLEIQKQIVAEIEKEKKIIDQLKELIKIYEQKIKDKIKEVWGE